MPQVSFDVTEEEKNWMEGFAKLRGASLAVVLKELLIEKVEDELDLQAIREHEAAKARGEVTYRTLAEVKKDLGFEG